jgi:hypothetical protein
MKMWPKRSSYLRFQSARDCAGSAHNSSKQGAKHQSQAALLAGRQVREGLQQACQSRRIAVPAALCLLLLLLLPAPPCSCLQRLQTSCAALPGLLFWGVRQRPPASPALESAVHVGCMQASCLQKREVCKSRCVQACKSAVIVQAEGINQRRNQGPPRKRRRPHLMPPNRACCADQVVHAAIWSSCRHCLCKGSAGAALEEGRGRGRQAHGWWAEIWICGISLSKQQQLNWGQVALTSFVLPYYCFASKIDHCRSRSRTRHTTATAQCTSHGDGPTDSVTGSCKQRGAAISNLLAASMDGLTGDLAG